ncbi:MAG: hypothetical protein ABII79_06040 [bacterium]
MRKSECPHSLRELADFALSVKYLREVHEMLNLYPSLAERVEIMQLHRRLVEYVEKSLELEKFRTLKELYQNPPFSTERPPDSLAIIFTIPLTWLGVKLRGESYDITSLPENKMKEEVDAILSESLSHVSPSLRSTIETLLRIMMFDCYLPHPTGEPEYNSKPRTLYLLTEYWILYSEYIMYRSTADVWFNPDPMLTFRTSVKVRIEQCIRLLDVEESLSDISEVLGMPLQDVDAIPEYISEIVDAASEALEVLRVNIGHATFQLTAQERMFVYAFRENFQKCRAQAEEWFHKLLRQVDHERKVKESQLTERTEPSCFEYIRKVEHVLRSLVETQYQEAFSDDWLDRIKDAIGEVAYENAVTTMKQRRVTDRRQLLHFTTFPDLQQAIIQNWRMFQPLIVIKRREFNKLIAPILSGRTEEAHNRPKHLWPEIEQQRVRIACSDLLKKIRS